MERTPEPEVMDGEAQARAYSEADFTEPHERFVALLRQALPHLAEAGVALDLGCGPADVTLRCARVLPGWMIDGLDASAPMLRLGRARVEAAGSSRRITLHQGYLPEAEAPRRSYDLVFSNSLLHHLHDPHVLWQCVRRWAAPGASVFVMDLVRPNSRPEAQALVERYSGGEPEILRHDFLHSLLAAYRPEEVRDQLTASGLAHLEVRNVSDRHLVVSGTV